jgi:alpha-glucoside transport system substrate-binding protein
VKPRFKAAGLAAAFAVFVTACSGGTASTAPSTAPSAAPASQPAASGSAAPSTGGGGTLDRALAGEFSGKTVTALGPFTDQDQVKFEAMVSAFESATGIDVQYEGTKEFEATIGVRVDGGNAPDVADFPQPGLLGNFAKAGKIVDLTPYLDQAALAANYNQSWLDMATMPGAAGDIMAGVWERVNSKSLVWYPKKAFDAAGYKVPTTWDELIALQEQIKADGDTPWCIGIESGAATGWPATDWTEDILLRTTSPENYDKWVAGELKFDSPEVKKAIETWSAIWLDPANVNGGTKGMVSTYFGDAPKAMFDDPPKCWLHRQGNFITSFFPQGKVGGVDYDFFYLPGIDPAYGKPALVAGDIWAAFADKPEAAALLEWFTKGEHLRSWMASGGAIAPQKDADLSWYGNDLERKIGELLGEATAVRFDASDLMPGQVGSGSFWKEMVSYISGSEDLDTALKNIDASWPTN